MSLKAGTRVPAGPIRRVVKKELLTQSGLTLEERIWGRHYDGRLLGYLFTYETLTFDKADKILSKLHLNHLWHTEPELSAIYDRPYKPLPLRERDFCTNGHPTKDNLTNQGSCRTCAKASYKRWEEKQNRAA